MVDKPRLAALGNLRRSSRAAHEEPAPVDQV